MSESKFVTKEELEETIKNLEKKLRVEPKVEGSIEQTTGQQTEQKIKAKREPSKYNIHMKNEMERIKNENPSMNAKERFKKSTESWNKSKNENEKVTEN